MQPENAVFARPLRLGPPIDAGNTSGGHAVRKVTRTEQWGQPIVRDADGVKTASPYALCKGVSGTPEHRVESAA